MSASDHLSGGQFNYFRGLHLGGLVKSTVVPPGHIQQEHLDPGNDEHVLSKIKTRRPEDLANPNRQHWGLYGSSWTDDPATARKFSLDSGHGQQRDPRPPTRPTYGAVIEAHTSEPVPRSPLSRYGETERQVPLPVVQSATLHLHYHPGNGEYLKPHETLLRSFPIPEGHWRNG